MANKRILIIDDDMELCEELTELLREEGYLVEYTQEPVKGESLIRGGRYDIILLDCKMSAQSGFDILRKLKDDNVRKRIFIVTGKPYVQQALEKRRFIRHAQRDHCKTHRF